SDFQAIDKIDLRNIIVGNGGLHFIGQAPFSGVAGEVRWDFSGSTTVIYFDSTGDGIADGRIIIDNGKFRLAEAVPGSDGLIVQPPVITSSSSFSVPENQTSIGIVTATDAAPITFSLTGGADMALFSINANTGALSFLAPKDFEAPVDASHDNV